MKKTVRMPKRKPGRPRKRWYQKLNANTYIGLGLAFLSTQQLSVRVTHRVDVLGPIIDTVTSPIAWTLRSIGSVLGL